MASRSSFRPGTKPMPAAFNRLSVPLQPYHAQSEDDAGNNDTVEGSSVGRGSQYLSGHDILDLWAARQAHHGEGGTAGEQRRREQPLGDVALLEQNQGDRVQGEHHHGKADAAIGEDGRGDNHNQQGPLAAHRIHDFTGDGFGRTAAPHQCAEQRAQEKHQEVVARIVLHKGPVVGAQRLPKVHAVGDDDNQRAHDGRGDHAPAFKAHHDQDCQPQDQAQYGDNVHDSPPSLFADLF